MKPFTAIAVLLLGLGCSQAPAEAPQLVEHNNGCLDLETHRWSGHPRIMHADRNGSSRTLWVCKCGCKGEHQRAPIAEILGIDPATKCLPKGVTHIGISTAGETGRLCW